MGADSFPALRAAVAPTGSPDPVLPARRGMILNYLRFPDDGVDIIQATLDWTGPLERAPLEAARHVAARLHPIVRTVFRIDDGDGLVQVIDPDASIDIRWRDLAQPQASGAGPPVRVVPAGRPAGAIRPDPGAAGTPDDPAPGRADRRMRHWRPGAPRGPDLPLRAAAVPAARPGRAGHDADRGRQPAAARGRGQGAGDART